MLTTSSIFGGEGIFHNIVIESLAAKIICVTTFLPSGGTWSLFRLRMAKSGAYHSVDDIKDLCPEMLYMGHSHIMCRRVTV